VTAFLFRPLPLRERTLFTMLYESAAYLSVIDVDNAYQNLAVSAAGGVAGEEAGAAMACVAANMLVAATAATMSPRLILDMTIFI
jgi:hypothetical protein